VGTTGLFEGDSWEFECGDQGKDGNALVMLLSEIDFDGSFSAWLLFSALTISVLVTRQSLYAGGALQGRGRANLVVAVAEWTRHPD
jgi:hypothetical protein